MPRKPTLSPTRLTTYLACPMKYRWTYVDDRGRWYLRSKSYYSFGTTLHGVLQRFHDSGDVGVTTTAEAAAALEESWIDAGYSSQEEMTQALAEGKEILDAYFEQVQSQPITANTLWVEKQLRMDMGPFILMGRLDRVDEHDDGTIEVIDYKSGREAVSEEDVQNDLAMAVYQLLLRDKFPDRPVTASIIALRTGAKATASLSDEDAEVLRRDLLMLGEEILNRDWEYLEPAAKGLCPRCDFLPLCRRHPEFEMVLDAENDRTV